MKFRYQILPIVQLQLLGALLLPAAVHAQSPPTLSLGAVLNVGQGLITDIQHSPADPANRLFVVTRNGKISIISNFDGMGGSGSTPSNDGIFLDINAQVFNSGERGLLGLAFDPDYVSNGFFYVNYVSNTNQDTTISRFSVSGTNPGLADAGSEVKLETIIQPYNNHNGGQLQFGPDGFLYVGMGDGGSGGDPENRAQDPTSLLGKMLRFDVSNGGWAAAGSSSSSLGPTFNSTIWAYGLRNPWRFSFDSNTDDMFIADVGQNAYEEVNFQPYNSVGGENYGWRPCEGLHGYISSSTDCSASNANGYVPPIFEYSHSVGQSITGGYVYRGSQYQSTLDGVYLYADYQQRKIFGAIPIDNTLGWEGAVNKMYFSIVSSSQPTTFGQDIHGEVYIGFSDGSVSQVMGPAPTPAPTRALSLSPTSSKMPSIEPTKFPTGSPFSVGVSCPANYEQKRVIAAGLVLSYSIVPDTSGAAYGGLFCAQLEYAGQAWVGFGFSVCAPNQIDDNACNKMGGGEVVIANPDGSSVKKYKLDGTSGANLAQAQTLLDTSMVQNATHTVMTYTKFLSEPNEMDIIADATNLCIYAVGPDNNVAFPAKHNINGFFILDQTPCPSEECPGGQVCQLPPCDSCGACSTDQAGCVSTNGCNWQQGGLVCPSGSGCPACTSASLCSQSGCNWNGKKCTGGSQSITLSSDCTGTAAPEYTCTSNANCGDGTCDAGETPCNCATDCGVPPSSENTCNDGVDEDCDGFTDCDDSECALDGACLVCVDPSSCTTDSECCSLNCREKGRNRNTCA